MIAAACGLDNQVVKESERGNERETAFVTEREREEREDVNNTIGWCKRSQHFLCRSYLAVKMMSVLPPGVFRVFIDLGDNIITSHRVWFQNGKAK